MLSLSTLVQNEANYLSTSCLHELKVHLLPKKSELLLTFAVFVLSQLYQIDLSPQIFTFLKSSFETNYNDANFVKISTK